MGTLGPKYLIYGDLDPLGIGTTLGRLASNQALLPKATLVPNTTPGIVFGTRVLQWAVYGPFGICASTLFTWRPMGFEMPADSRHAGLFCAWLKQHPPSARLEGCTCPEGP